MTCQFLGVAFTGSKESFSAGLQKDLDLAAAGQCNNVCGGNSHSYALKVLAQDMSFPPAEAGAPATFYCPISFRVLRDPVMLPTGQT